MRRRRCRGADWWIGLWVGEEWELRAWRGEEGRRRACVCVELSRRGSNFERGRLVWSLDAGFGLDFKGFREGILEERDGERGRRTMGGGSADIYIALRFYCRRRRALSLVRLAECLPVVRVPSLHPVPLARWTAQACGRPDRGSTLQARGEQLWSSEVR